MTLDIDWESIEAVHQCLISEFLLPLSPLIIKHIVQGWNRIPLLPLIQEIYVCGWRVEAMQLCLSTEDIFRIKG